MGHGEPGGAGRGARGAGHKGCAGVSEPHAEGAVALRAGRCRSARPERRSLRAAPRSASLLCLPARSAGWIFILALCPCAGWFKCICSSGDNPCKSEALAPSARFTKRTQLQEVTRSQLLLPLYFSLIAELLHVYSDWKDSIHCNCCLALLTTFFKGGLTFYHSC